MELRRSVIHVELSTVACRVWFIYFSLEMAKTNSSRDGKLTPRTPRDARMAERSRTRSASHGPRGRGRPPGNEYLLIRQSFLDYLVHGNYF